MQRRDNVKENFKEDPRFEQCNKETWVMVILLVLNILWWYGFAYGLGSKSPSEYGFILGLPGWFFWSCVMGWVVFSFAAYYAVKIYFKDIPLDDGGQSQAGQGVKK
ncbi:MAG TPA: YhdT family protein [Firmicutes bacterium]|uniref:YhdT family protein n=1 Tax=Candidatus Fermentithermobacillus carboniphilus TaxID=3085328 RepID=A0AAT9LEQ7_9FIRM|nr:MAG: YhdT family protein [Candidatus Fermentithermobacillus carboniphilus]HHW18066.1 YhdT family protein [Candidatus Fermentithermobacillaceae bacterium]